jgi:molybdopterin synthase catalytic subunit
MLVRIRLFAALRERAGRDTVELELADGATVSDALAAVDEIAGGLSLVLAVNREYAPETQVLHADDELALIPPVSGGAQSEPHILITGDPLSLDSVVARVADPRAGAVVTFAGVTREVAWLDYEAYAEMAGPMLRSIVMAAIDRHGLCAAAAEHRIGRVALGEPSVIVATSAPHRPEAFLGARQIIDELKAQAPIWKAEEGEWVIGTPPASPEASPLPRASRRRSR